MILITAYRSNRPHQSLRDPYKRSGIYRQSIPGVFKENHEMGLVREDVCITKRDILDPQS